MIQSYLPLRIAIFVLSVPNLMFAFKSLLYHIYSGRRPFEDLPDNSVEKCFANVEFPADRPNTLNTDQWPMILFSGSLEFPRDLHDSILFPFPSY